MEPSHYWGFEKNIELFIAGTHIELPRAGVRAELGHFIINDDFDFSEAPHQFDMAIAAPSSGGCRSTVWPAQSPRSCES